PPVSSIQPLTPPALGQLIRTCLAKDPDERWQTAHDIRIQLKHISEGTSQAGVPAPGKAKSETAEVIASSLGESARAAGRQAREGEHGARQARTCGALSQPAGSAWLRLRPVRHHSIVSALSSPAFASVSRRR